MFDKKMGGLSTELADDISKIEGKTYELRSDV